jgi:UDP-glucose 4-epimerase
MGDPGGGSTNKSGRRVLITGGAGFIGSHLSELLLARGYRVTAIDDVSTGSLANVQHLQENDEYSLVIDSITNEVVMDRLMSETDVTFHLAAAVGVDLIVNDPVRVIETNILGTHVVLNAASRYRSKVLLASTSEIYGKSESPPFAEDDDRLMGPTTRSRWSYAASKAVDEFLALAYHKQKGLPVTIFRLFNTVGPRQTGQYGMVVPRFVEQAVNGEPLTVYGDGNQSRCFCDVRDVVRAIVGLAEAEEALGEVFNIGSEREISIMELARLVRRIVGVDAGAEPVLVPYEEAYQPGFEDMMRRVPDTGRILRTIGWKPEIDLETTIADVATHLSKAPPRRSGTGGRAAVERAPTG